MNNYNLGGIKYKHLHNILVIKTTNIQLNNFKFINIAILSNKP